MSAGRRLNDWLEQLPAWRFAVICGALFFTLLFSLTLVFAGAVQLGHHFDPGFFLVYGSVFTIFLTIVMTTGLTLGRQWRQRHRTRVTDHRPPPEP